MPRKSDEFAVFDQVGSERRYSRRWPATTVDTAAVTVTVTGVIFDPTAFDDAYPAYTTDEDSALTVSDATVPSLLYFDNLAPPSATHRQ